MLLDAKNQMLIFVFDVSMNLFKQERTNLTDFFLLAAAVNNIHLLFSKFNNGWFLLCIVITWYYYKYNL